MSLKYLKFAGLLMMGASALNIISATAALAAPVDQSEIDALKAQIKALERRLNTVQAVQDTKISEIKTKQDAVEIKFENGRPTFRTPDGYFEMALRGRMNYDTAAYFQDDDHLPAIAPGRDLSSGTNFRRAQLGVEGKFMRDWEYKLEFNFGGSGVESGGVVHEALISYTALKPLKIEIGTTKPPMTLDESISSNDTMFLERAAAASMAAGFAGGDGRSSVGVRGNTNNYFASLYYTKGLVGEGGFDEQNALVGRTAYRIAPNADSNIHIGASATRVFGFNQPASGPVFTLQERPELRVDGARLISTGSLGSESALVYGPELAGNWKNFYAQGEYYSYQIDRAGGAPQADFDAWYVQASYIVTGEAKPYDMKSAAFGAPKPNGPFGFGDSLGAIELAARYSTANLDDHASNAICPATFSGSSATLNPTGASGCIRGGQQDIITLGLNWYPNRNVRFMLDYMIGDIERRAYSNNSTANGGPNAQIGQDFEALALRTQFNW
ncbi:MAG: hypothetical protein EXR08_01025 [Alphaproteobacteria bacterium]|nr:hypothetical protein [Alphaproteobacteria bacterium]